jgi:hypothetical protein
MKSLFGHTLFRAVNGYHSFNTCNIRQYTVELRPPSGKDWP